MEIGVCGSPELAKIAKSAGLDYFEWSVGEYLQPRSGEDPFLQALKKVKDSPVPCPAVNVFIPADLKITGPVVNDAALHEFVQIAMDRAAQAGIDIIVFGSGGARRVPDNFNPEAAYQQLLEFGKMVAEEAQRCGIRVAVEPLNRNECNILNSVAESAQYVREINHPNLRLLVDAYHWLKEAESAQAILDAHDLLIHAHIATPANRMPPGAEEFDFAPFFNALKAAGYTGRLSIEARLDKEDTEHELRNALRFMRQYI